MATPPNLLVTRREIKEIADLLNEKIAVNSGQITRTLNLMETVIDRLEALEEEVKVLKSGIQ